MVKLGSDSSLCHEPRVDVRWTQGDIRTYAFLISCQSVSYMDEWPSVHVWFNGLVGREGMNHGFFVWSSLPCESVLDFHRISREGND